ncbi:Sensor histidine kinase, partial [Pseudomonas savastanoi pv. glycinea]
LAAAAGGSLSAEHPGDGGTTFVLSLPFVPDAPTDNRPSGPGPGGLT